MRLHKRVGRRGQDRTDDLSAPNGARYQAALHTDLLNLLFEECPRCAVELPWVPEAIERFHWIHA